MNDTYSYDKEEIKEILDYAIRKIEQNISTIKDQQIEIDRLKKELEISRNIPYNYNYEKEEQIKKELKENAKKEAELIINEARNNANKIINDALIETQKLDMKKEMLEKNIKQLCKNLWGEESTYSCHRFRILFRYANR